MICNDGLLYTSATATAMACANTSDMGHEAQVPKLCKSMQIMQHYSKLWLCMELYGKLCKKDAKVSFSLNWPQWADAVIESRCPSVCLSVCLCVCLRHRMQFFRGLSLALRSHDQFQANTNINVKVKTPYESYPVITILLRK